MDIIQLFSPLIVDNGWLQFVQIQLSIGLHSLTRDNT